MFYFVTGAAYSNQSLGYGGSPDSNPIRLPDFINHHLSVPGACHTSVALASECTTPSECWDQMPRLRFAHKRVLVLGRKLRVDGVFAQALTRGYCLRPATEQGYLLLGLVYGLRTGVVPSNEE